MNITIQHGRLTKEPEVRYTQAGKAVATFTLAVNRPKSQNENSPSADFFPYVVWGKLAEVVGNYLQKGSEIVAEGHLQTRNYEAKDGGKRYVTEIIMDKFEFVGSKAKADGGNSENRFGSQVPSLGGNVPTDDDIPF